MSQTPFNTLLPTRSLWRPLGLKAWFWGFVGGMSLCGVLLCLALMLDLWIHKGVLQVATDDLPAAAELLHDPLLGTPEGTLSNRGLLPTTWRARDRWWGPILAKATSFFPATRTNQGAVAFLLIGGMLFALARIGARARIRNVAEDLALSVSSSLRSHLYRQSLRLGPGDLDGARRERAEHLFTHEVNTMRDGVSEWLTILTRDVVTLAFLFVLGLLVDWQIFIICAIPLVACWWFVGFERRQGEARRLQSEENAAQAMRLLGEGLSKARLIRGYAMDNFEQERFQKNLQQFQSEISAGHRRQSWSRRLARIAVAWLAAMMLYFVGAAVLSGTNPLEVSDGFLLLSCFLAATPSAGMLGSMLQARKAVNRAGLPVYSYINEIPEVGQAVGAKFLEPLSRTIIFESVSYKRAGRDVLKQLDLRIPAGTTTAIVSLDPLAPRTIGLMLPRFIEPQSGRVLYDSEDTAWATLESLRAETLYVSGSDNCFTGTVLENITGGDSRYSLSDVTDAAKMVHAHGFIVRFSLGYETGLGERGERLDPGQAFRIALARAVLRKPAVMIIEEPDTPLDDDTKTILEDAYQRISKGRTVIFLPNRLSTVRKCDQIALIAEGKVGAMGSHADLLKSSELYRHWEYLLFNTFRKRG